MELTTQIEKIKTLAKDVRSLLPKYGEAELSVQIETVAELQLLGIAMERTVSPPCVLMNYHWFTYTIAGIRVTVKTPDAEVAQEKPQYKYSGN